MSSDLCMIRGAEAACIGNCLLSDDSGQIRTV